MNCIERKTMKKKSLLPLFGLVIMLSGWWFMQQEPEPSPEAGVLDVWATWGDTPEQLQALFDRFGQANGIPVRVRTRVRGDDLPDALARTQPPDVVILSSNQRVQAYRDQGLIEALDAWIEIPGIDLADIYPASLAQCTAPDGTILCLPWGEDVFALYWNKDLFAAAGLDPERPPETMEELAEYARILTLVDEEGNPVRMGFLPDFSRSHTDLYARMIGGFWLNAEGTKVAANSQPVIEALRWQTGFFEIFARAGMKKFALAVNGFSNSNHPVHGGARLNCQQCHRARPRNGEKIPDHSFYDGKVAMMVDGQWQLNSAYIPHFQPDLNYGVAAFPPPAGHPERAGTTIIQGPVVVIPAKATDQDTAAKLLAWMATPEIVAEISLANAMLPTSKAAAEDPRFQQIPYFDVFIDLLSGPNAQFTPSASFSLELNEALSQAEKAALYEENGLPDALLDEVQARFSP
jgi:multiple sugar transport system substrate-binding protein